MSKPQFIGVDHVSWTVPDLDAAVRFYVEVFGAKEIYRMGPMDCTDIPLDGQGRDWLERHVNVRGARLSMAMLRLAPNLNFELFQYDKPSDRATTLPRNCDRGGHHIAIKVDDVDNASAYLRSHGCQVFEAIVTQDGPFAGLKNVYFLDPWGHQLELVE